MYPYHFFYTHTYSVQPYHTVIETDSKEDLTDESVMTKLQEQRYVCRCGLDM